MGGVQSLPQNLGSVQDVDRAEHLLGQILELFANAEAVSVKFENRIGRTKQEMILHDTQTDLEPVALSLHHKMHNLSIKRQNRTSLRQKAKWALYEEKHFRRLMEDITGSVDDLVKLFPAAHASQKELCKTEVAEMDINGNLQILQAVVETQDKLLQEVINETLNQNSLPSSVSFSGSHNSGFQLAYNTGAISGLRWGGST